MYCKFRVYFVFTLIFVATISSAQDSSGMHMIARISSTGLPTDVYTNSEIGYLCARQSTLKIMNLSNPYNPQLISNFPLGTSWANHCDVGETTCMVANGNDGIRAIDMSEFTRPTQTTLFSLNAFVSDVACILPCVFAATYQRGIVIVSYEHPNNPTEIGRLAINGEAFSARWRDGLLYVACGDGGLTIADVNNPAAPTQLSRLQTPGHAYVLALYDNYCYIANGSSGVQIINVTNPVAPRIVGVVPNRGLANHIVVFEQHLYVTYYGGGVAVYDLSDPLHPHITGWYNYGGSTVTITAWRNFALSSNTSGYYDIFNCSDAIVPVEEKKNIALPQDASLNFYPNPFNSSTTVRFDLPHREQVSVFVTDALGRRVTTLCNEVLQPGSHQLHLSGNQSLSASGEYYITMKAKDYSISKKAVYVK